MLARSEKINVQQQNRPITVTKGNEAGVDLVLIQPFLLSYINNAVLMLTSIPITKQRIVCIEQGQPHIRAGSARAQSGFQKYEF